MELLTVGEMARRSGVPATTLRYYDSLGLLRPVRLANKHRRYLEEDLERLRFIKLCAELGCELGDIPPLLRPDAPRQRRRAAERELARVERQMRRLAITRVVLSHFAECDCEDTPQCRATIRRALNDLAHPGEEPPFIVG